MLICVGIITWIQSATKQRSHSPKGLKSQSTQRTKICLMPERSGAGAFPKIQKWYKMILILTVNHQVSKHVWVPHIFFLWMWNSTAWRKAQRHRLTQYAGLLLFWSEFRIRAFTNNDYKTNALPPSISVATKSFKGINFTSVKDLQLNVPTTLG